MNLIIVISGIFWCGIIVASYPPLPDWFKTCKRQPQPQINDCIKEKSILVLPELLKGVKAFKIPNFIPLQLKEVSVINEGNFNLKLREIDLYGFDSGKIINIQFDLPGNQFDGRLSFDQLQMNATYEIDGKIIILPIKGRGQGFLKLSGILLDAHVDWFLRQDGDFHLFEVTKLKVNYTVEKMFVHFDNLFGDNKKMGAEMNAFVNENWNNFHETIRSTIEAMIENTALALIVNIAKHIPLEYLFPL